ncbi:protein of unknown function [Candidatus Filomicrobium marinum]|nr:protein of unknown function [Candidatus Filomicrobium marinum]
MMRPAIWSTSAFVTTTALIGVLRRLPLRTAPSSGVSLICWRRSGEALSKSQSVPFALTASDDWVRGENPGSPARALAQFEQLQFHCGKPPPAADPNTFMIMCELIVSFPAITVPVP